MDRVELGQKLPVGEGFKSVAEDELERVVRLRLGYRAPITSNPAWS